MNAIVRLAERKDCPRLLELIKELADYEQSSHEVKITVQEFEDAGFGHDPVWKAFVAEADGTIQGLALFYIRYSTWTGRHMYLEDLLVTEKMRGKGIGKLLFDQLIVEAEKKACNGITFQVLSWNEPALKFYRQYGAQFEDKWLNGTLSVKGRIGISETK